MRKGWEQTLFEAKQNLYRHLASVTVGEMTQFLDKEGVADKSADYFPVIRRTRRIRDASSPASPQKITRDEYKAVTERQSEEMAARATAGMRSYFRDSIMRGMRRFVRMNITLDPNQAREQAWAITTDMWDLDEERDLLVMEASRVLLALFVVGARSEEAMLEMAEAKSTTAQDVMDRLEMDVPAGISLGPYPQWMLLAATEVLTETFEQDYWRKIPETTRNDVRVILAEAIRKGKSTQSIASDLMETFGDDYTKVRANATARTEIGAMANAGHEAAILNLQDELGEPVGKEWLSVLGQTTRDTHANADGQVVVGAKGMFILAGIPIPYPGHMSLPAGERINCRCTIASTFVTAELLSTQV